MHQALEQIKNAQGESSFLLATVVEGSEVGDKALLRDGVLMVSPADGSLLARHLPQLAQQTDSGLVTLEDCRLFVERFSEKPRLVICGGGTVGLALVSVMRGQEFSVTVLEDREAYAQRAKELGADTVVTAPFGEGLDGIVGGGSTYFVVVTREHQYDTLCLDRILRKEHAYVGMMGSRKRVGILKDELAEAGFSRELLDTIHAPIGLKIAAETPEEIAVSIAAELILTKNQQKRTAGYSKELLEVLANAPRPCVLAQIVERKGSTPRGIGTKMVIFEDGTGYGTIGGGWMEADVIKKALALLKSGETTRLCHEMLSPAGQGAANPMLCGGEQLVYLEVLS